MSLDRFSRPLWGEQKSAGQLEEDALDAYKQQVEDSMLDSLEGGEQDNASDPEADGGK
ncbi:hypothetical protein [Paenibacillus campinasensis]|uniref:hypothetical protein n=1 Tax=Paenibacillus campinasensis TaxID=66347 RepID=UPI0015CA7B50|nr:hypothetical protein [Paenibacillus campinasensis]